MTCNQCTADGRPSGPLARSTRKLVTSLLPAAMLALLPKCPLCLAAWLTAVTGLGVSAATATMLRSGIVAVWLTVLAAAVLPMLRAVRPRT